MGVESDRNILITAVSLSEKIIITNYTKEELKSLIKDCLTELIVFKSNPENTDSKELLTVADLSQLLGIAKQTVYDKIVRKEIPYHKTGKKLLFRRSEIDEWIDSKRVKTLDEMKRDVAKILVKPRARKNK